MVISLPYDVLMGGVNPCHIRNIVAIGIGGVDWGCISSFYEVLVGV